MDNDACKTLHQLTVDVAVIRQKLAGDKEALELAAKEYTRRLELVELSNQLPDTYVSRALHDKLDDKVNSLSLELAAWQARLFMLSAIFAGIVTIASIVVTAYHYIPK